MLNRVNKDIVKDEALHPLGIGKKRSLLMFAWAFACLSNQRKREMAYMQETLHAKLSTNIGV